MLRQAISKPVEIHVTSGRKQWVKTMTRNCGQSMSVKKTIQPSYNYVGSK
jgi:hypothetical protein